ncbi:hypothetical protein ANRL4_00029 [Anaerolineae bacterium]|nr:hypothetical protein ANRL4_00029 [Anaerolineae bacterium]
MNAHASTPATWQSAVGEQLPELATPPEGWNTINVAASCSKFLEQASRQANHEALRRALNIILLLERTAGEDETLVYAVQDILRRTIESAKLREQFTSVLNARTFGQLAGYIEYVSSREVVAEMSGVVGLRKRGA